MLASDSASALLSTISESPSTQYNDYVYSESSNIAPVTSVNWEPIEPSSGTVTSTLHFPLSKNGWATRAVLALSGVLTGADNFHIASPIQHCIHEITLSSQGRTICTLNTAAIMAIASAAPSDVRAAYEEGAQLVSGASGVGAKTYSYFLDIPMFFGRYLKTSLLTTFNQTMQISVSFASYQGNRTVFGTGANFEITQPKLYVQYRNLMESVTQQTVSENQDSGLLSMILPTWDYESPLEFPMKGVTFIAADAGAGIALRNAIPDVGGTPFTVPLKSTSCVERMYVVCMLEPSTPWDNLDVTQQPALDAGAALTWGRPFELTGNLVFSSNGTRHFDIPVDVLRIWGHPKQGGSSGLSTSQAAHTFTAAYGNGLPYVYCIELCPDDGQKSDHISNLLSLRELSSAQVSGTIKALPMDAGGATADQQAAANAAVGKNITVRVCHSRRELASIVSSNGAYRVALSN